MDTSQVVLNVGDCVRDAVVQRVYGAVWTGEVVRVYSEPDGLVQVCWHDGQTEDVWADELSTEGTSK